MFPQESPNINLLNFDQTTFKDAILTSPRSIKACNLQGISPRELIIRTIANIQELFPDNIIEIELLQKRVENYEKRRKIKLNQLKLLRDQIIKEESLGKNTSKIKNQKGETQSELIEKEKKLLQIIKQRQQKEIEQIIEQELYAKEQSLINQKKLQEQLIKEQERKVIIERRNAEELEQKQKREEEKRKRQQQEENKLLLLIEEKKEKQIQRLKNKEVAEREKENKLKEQEEISKKKKDDLKKLKEEKQRKKEEMLEEEQKKIQEKQIEKKNVITTIDFAIIKLKALEKIKEELYQKSQEKQLLHDKRMLATKEKNELKEIEQKQLLQQKEEKLQKKRAIFEEQMRKEKEENQIKAIEHQKLIQKIQSENQRKEIEKSIEEQKKLELAQQRKKEFDKFLEEEQKVRKEQEQEKIRQRNQIILQNQTLYRKKISDFRKNMQKAEQRLLQITQVKSLQMKEKYNDSMIKQQEKAENISKMLRIQNYQKHKLQEKLQDGNERANQLKKELDNLLNSRAEQRNAIQQNKAQLNEKFKKIAKQEINIEVLEEFGLKEKAEKFLSRIEQVQNSISLNNTLLNTTFLSTTGNNKKIDLPSLNTSFNFPGKSKRKTFLPKLLSMTENQDILLKTNDSSDQINTSLMDTIETLNQTKKSQSKKMQTKKKDELQLPKNISLTGKKIFYQIQRDGPYDLPEAHQIYNQFEFEQNQEMLRFLEKQQEKQTIRDSKFEKIGNSIERAKAQKQYEEQNSLAINQTTIFLKQFHFYDQCNEKYN